MRVSVPCGGHGQAPKRRSSSSCTPLRESVFVVAEAVREVLEKTPPELASDITEHGIVMTGGGSLFRGLDRVIGEEVGIPCFVADDPTSCVAIGTGKYIEQLSC